MKNTWYVWTKEPYGQWEKASSKPSTHAAAAELERRIQSSGRPIATQVLEGNQKPQQQG